MDFSKLDASFQWVKGVNRVGFSKKKIKNNSNLGHSSVDKYMYELHTMYNYMEENYGLEKVEKVTPKMMYQYYTDRSKEYHEGNTAIGWHLHSLDDAIHAFQHFAVESGQYSYTPKLGKKEKMEAILKEEKVKRHSADTSVNASNREDISAVCDYLRNEVGTSAANVAADVLWGEFVSGKRISAQLRHRVGDYDKENGTLMSWGDKGGKNNKGRLKEEAKEHYNKLTMKEDGAEKKAGAPMLSIKYVNGDKAGMDKTIAQMRTQVSDLIKDASDILLEQGIISEPVSSHGARKAYAQEGAEELIVNYEREELQKILDDMIKDDPKLQRKVNNVMENIRSKFKIKENAAKRQFTKKDLVSLITSIEISHSRIDVMRFYLTKDFWERMASKHPGRLH
jgi:hypothetical protein